MRRLAYRVVLNMEWFFRHQWIETNMDPHYRYSERERVLWSIYTFWKRARIRLG